MSREMKLHQADLVNSRPKCTDYMGLSMLLILAVAEWYALNLRLGGQVSVGYELEAVGRTFEVRISVPLENDAVLVLIFCL